jgi:hypothetical protein
MISKPRRERGDFGRAAHPQRTEGGAVEAVGISRRAASRARRHGNPECRWRINRRRHVGGFGPTVNGLVAQGKSQRAMPRSAPLKLIVRGKALDAEVASLPLFPPSTSLEVQMTYYTSEHEWISVEGGRHRRHRRSRQRSWATSFVNCRISAVGEEGRRHGGRWLVKAASDVTPVSGSVTEANTASSRTREGQRRS